MMRIRPVLLALLATTALAVFLTSGASASSTGSISCALVGGGTLPIVPSGDYQLSPGDTISCTITGASAPKNNATTTTVYIKHGGTPTSSSYPLSGNNEQVPATYSGGVISFTYSTSGLTSCKTAALAYNTAMGAMKNSKGASSMFDFNNFCQTTSTPPPPPDASALTGRASGSASFSRAYTWGIDKSVDQTSASYVIGQDSAPTFNYTVSVTHDDGTDSGWAASGTIRASNVNGADVNGVTASMSNGNCTVTGGSQTVPANSSATWNFSCSFGSAGPSSLAATVSWGAQTLSDGSVLAAGSAPASASLDWSTPTSTTNGSVTVSDNAGNLGTVDASTDSSPQTFTYSLQLDGTAGTCDYSFTNTASLSGDNGSSSQTVNVCAIEDPALAPIGADPSSESFTRTYTWGIDKTAGSTSQNIPAGGSATFSYTVNVTHDGGTDSGWSADGTITATNGNVEDVTGATATIDDANCTVIDGAQTIPANGSQSWNYSCSWNSAPPSSLGIHVNWPEQSLMGGDLQAGSADGSENLDWSTPSNVVNGSVDVSDSLAGSLGTANASDPSWSDTYTISFPGVSGTCTSYDNTASLSTGESSTATVNVCDGADLQASATGSTSYTRTYGWTIGKKVNGSALVEKTGGGTGTFSYTVTATHDAGTDSAWASSGTITVTNPNDWEGITANVTVATDNGGTCTVANGTGVALAANGSATLNYSCTWASAPSSLTGTATATVSWDSTAATTPHGSTTATGSASFGAPSTIVNGSTVVTDSLKGTLGTAYASGPASTSWTYSLSFAVPTTNCVTKPNTASLSVGGSASASVELCGPATTGALSQGFWQSKNGQAIINAGSATGGVCNLATWLRGYAPFQDLSATASCSATNTYVQKIISAASASGASMNAMLKSQMLAVSLDVYFSDPSLGGNKIGAPAPIGGVNVDLTNVKGVNESAGFGGATHMTVSQLLSYAASQSNAGGTQWYGQVKAAQTMPKDTFDAICNSLVYSP